MGQVNRSLPDPNMDEIDHALGRPRDPFDSYRSHYVVDAETPLAKAMSNSPWWEESVRINNGNDIVFHVTLEGRKALAEYLGKTK